MKKDVDFIKCILPEEVYTHFNIVDIQIKPTELDLFLDEKLTPPFSLGYISKGFTDTRVIQDFPLRGKSVYLHIRRRKWQNIQTGEVITSSYDLAHQGTQITTEFAAFLKEIDRKYKSKY